LEVYLYRARCCAKCKKFATFVATDDEDDVEDVQEPTTSTAQDVINLTMDKSQTQHNTNSLSRISSSNVTASTITSSHPLLQLHLTMLQPVFMVEVE